MRNVTGTFAEGVAARIKEEEEEDDDEFVLFRNTVAMRRRFQIDDKCGNTQLSTGIFLFFFMNIYFIFEGKKMKNMFHLRLTGLIGRVKPVGKEVQTNLLLNER